MLLDFYFLDLWSALDKKKSTTKWISESILLNAVARVDGLFFQPDNRAWILTYQRNGSGCVGFTSILGSKTGSDELAGAPSETGLTFLRNCSSSAVTGLQDLGC
jgi:hypothetical protein